MRRLRLFATNLVFSGFFANETIIIMQSRTYLFMIVIAFPGTGI